MQGLSFLALRNAGGDVDMAQVRQATAVRCPTRGHERDKHPVVGKELACARRPDACCMMVSDKRTIEYSDARNANGNSCVRCPRACCLAVRM